MASLTYNTGFEHGVSPPGTSGAGLFSVVTGSPTIQSAVKRTGNYALRCYADTAAQTYVGKALTNSDYGVIRFYFRLAAWPSASVRIFLAHNAAASNRVAAIIHTDHKLYFGRQAPGDAQLYDMTLALDTWYRIDMRVYYNATTYVLDAQVDGDPVTQYTLGSMTATSFSAPYAGLLDTATGDIYYDDMAVSQTSGDYPLGAGQGKGISPNAAGTSSPNPATKIYDNASVLVNDSSNPANIELDDVPISIDTDYIKQTTIGTSDYVEVNFADLSDAATVNGARALLAYMSSGTSSNDGKSYIIDEDAVSTTLFSGDMSESSMFYKSVQLPVTAGGWDQAAVNALKARIGYSSDITPVPYWENLMIEVDYVVQAGNTYYEAPANAFSSTPVCTPSTFLAMSPSLAAFVSTPTLAPVVIADLVGGVGLTSVPAMTPAAVADFLASITLASTPAQVSAAIADFYLSLVLSSNPALSVVGGSDFYNSIVLSSGPTLSASALKEISEALTLLSHPALSTQNIANLLAAITMSSNPALTAVAILDILVTISLASDPALAIAGGLDFYTSLILLSTPSILIDVLAILKEYLLAITETRLPTMYKVPYITNDSRMDENFNYLARSLSSIPTGGAPEAHNFLSASHGDTLVDSVVRGDILYGDATPKWARLVKGTAGLLIGYSATDIVQINPNTLDVDKIDGLHASAFILAESMGSMFAASDITNTTQVMADITGLSFAIAANKSYSFELRLRVYSSTGVNGIWYQFTGPASPVSVWALFEYALTETSTVVFERVTAFNVATAAPSQSTSLTLCRITGIINNGDNAGTVQLQFRNETAANTVKVLLGSRGEWRKNN